MASLFGKLALWLKKEARLTYRVKCPCCGYPTIFERSGHDICKLCNWQDDGQDDLNAKEIFGGPNGIYSLDEARSNFKKYQIMYSPSKPATSIGGNSNTSVELKAKKELMNAFDSCPSLTEFDMNSEIWKSIEMNEAILVDEMIRKIKEHEK